MAYYYDFNKKKLDFALCNFERIAWLDFATRKDFPDFGAIGNPFLTYGSSYHKGFKEKFEKFYGCNCYFPFILRVVNSFLITGAKQNPTKNAAEGERVTTRRVEK